MKEMAWFLIGAAWMFCLLLMFAMCAAASIADEQAEHHNKREWRG